jgi:hypothetical protein
VNIIEAKILTLSTELELVSTELQDIRLYLGMHFTCHQNQGKAKLAIDLRMQEGYIALMNEYVVKYTPGPNLPSTATAKTSYAAKPAAAVSSGSVAIPLSTAVTKPAATKTSSATKPAATKTSSTKKRKNKGAGDSERRPKRFKKRKEEVDSTDSTDTLGNVLMTSPTGKKSVAKEEKNDELADNEGDEVSENDDEEESESD